MLSPRQLLVVAVAYLAALASADCDHNNCYRGVCFLLAYSLAIPSRAIELTLFIIYYQLPAVLASAYATRSGLADCQSYFLTTVTADTRFASPTPFPMLLLLPPPAVLGICSRIRIWQHRILLRNPIHHRSVQYHHHCELLDGNHEQLHLHHYEHRQLRHLRHH